MPSSVPASKAKKASTSTKHKPSTKNERASTKTPRQAVEANGSASIYFQYDQECLASVTSRKGVSRQEIRNEYSKSTISTLRGIPPTANAHRAIRGIIENGGFGSLAVPENFETNVIFLIGVQKWIWPNLAVWAPNNAPFSLHFRRRLPLFSASPKNKEVSRVGEDIRDIVGSLDPDEPSQVRTRWFGYKPAPSSNHFLLIIATGCHTKISNLPIASLKWKFDRPANAAKKGLTNKTAYDVMIKSLVDRKKDYVFSVYMQPPTVVKKELPWIKDENDASPPDFEYNPATPHRALSNPFGTRSLRVWAVAKAKGDATIDKPPASTHFFKNQTIKPPHASSLPAPSLAAENPQNPLLQLLLGQPSVLQQIMTPYQLTFPHSNPYGLPPNPYYGYPQIPNLPAPHGGLPPAALPHAPESEPVELPREILLEEYFERYKLNAEDRRVLTELGYVPSDEGIKDLDAAAWQATKVLPLAKARILRQHAAFLKDITERLWKN
ncbi:hypothetical protein B0H13DRAFT_1905584 [Mycena leptocephala]|nr:hypothetical protein B0H13DRAFT_1905584 [Mycena leptocephala]